MLAIDKLGDFEVNRFTNDGLKFARAGRDEPSH